MNTLIIPPDNSGYKADLGDSNVSIDLDGGAPRVRADKIGAVSKVTVQWTVDNKGFDYLMAFYRTGAGANGAPGSLPFQIQLVGIDGSEPQLYTCLFVPGTFGLRSQSGLTYIVGAQLWVTPIPPTAAQDTTTMSTYVL